MCLKLFICRLMCNGVAVTMLNADIGLTVSFTAEQAQQLQSAFVSNDLGDLLSSAENIQHVLFPSADASSGKADANAGYLAMLTAPSPPSLPSNNMVDGTRI